MSSLFSIALAAAAIFLPVWIWLGRLLPPGQPGRQLLLCAYALLLCLPACSLVLRLLSALGVAFSPASMALSTIVLALAGYFAPGRWRAANATVAERPADSLAGWRLWLYCLLAALIASRLAALGLEVLWRPVFAWDAKQHWALQARVFFEWRRVVPYVPLSEWLEMEGKGVFTTHHSNYPVTVPLIQTWMATALGRWDSSLVNLPWVAMWIALGLVFYAQARQARTDRLTALGATYMALSLPYLNTQVALAGYADLLLGVCYLAAVSAFYQWSVRRESWQLGLALLCGLACPMIKHEGFFWLLSLLAGILFVYWGNRRSLLVAAPVLVPAGLLLWWLLSGPGIAGQTWQSLEIAYRPEGWGAIFRSFLLHDNWHLLMYAATALLLAGFLLGRFRSLIELFPVLLVIAGAMLMYLGLYLLTRNAHGAVYYTSLNRVALQIVPALGFVTLLLYWHLAKSLRHSAQSAPDVSLS